MSERMKGFTCCGDCIHYNYKKHKCNLGASIETDARNHFYDDCPIPDIPNEKEIRDKAIEEFVKGIKDWQDDIYDNERNPMVYDFVFDRIYEIAEQMKEVGE